MRARMADLLDADRVGRSRGPLGREVERSRGDELEIDEVDGIVRVELAIGDDDVMGEDLVAVDQDQASLARAGIDSEDSGRDRGPPRGGLRGPPGLNPWELDREARHSASQKLHSPETNKSWPTALGYAPTG